MGKMKDALRKLGFKVNGKTPSGDSTAKIIDDIAENYEGGSGGGVEYITVSIDGGTLTAEQLTKVFDNGIVKEGVFFRLDNIILVSSGHPREQVFNSTVINGKCYSMEVDEFTGVYTVTEVSVGGGSEANLYVHTIAIEGQYDSGCSVQLVTPDSNQYDYFSLAEYIMNRGIPVYEGEGEVSDPTYWYIPTSGVLVIPPQTEEGDATYGVASRLIATVVGSGSEEQDYNLRIAGIGFDGNQAGDDYSVVQDVVTPMVQANNNEEEEPPVEEGPATEE